MNRKQKRLWKRAERRYKRADRRARKYVEKTNRMIIRMTDANKELEKINKKAYPEEEGQ